MQAMWATIKLALERVLHVTQHFCPINLWMMHGMDRIMLSGQNLPAAQKNFVQPKLARAVWHGLKVLKVHPISANVVQPVGSEPLKLHVERVTAKKDLKSRKIAHIWTGETRFQVAPHVQWNTVVKIPTKLIVPAGDLTPVTPTTKTPELRPCAWQLVRWVTPANKDYPDMTQCSMPRLTAYMSNYFLDAGLLQLTMHSSKQLSSHVNNVTSTSRIGSFVLGFSPPNSVMNVGPHHRPAPLIATPSCYL